ncbi:hypothetical protein M501DRAFT_1007943 [Patellaria atrata CBS 101060]|uniref:2EXR domain-containing protein n=1 Tax=Patellaria atrata CBS 101060 TaxID=1346257 RepID=A0A9P4SFY8_9PEZI|nr:hypothetical protein M501DRAFT_1007943 [Patellaria atrata CBS 101060]
MDEPNIQPFRFMDLPAELRIQIYHLTLTRLYPVVLCNPDLMPASRSSTSVDSSFHPRESSLGRNTYFDVLGLRPTDICPMLLKPPYADRLDGQLLRVSKQIRHEAHPVLYGNNTFILHLDSATATLASLHQRSRSLIKHVEITIPTHHDILEAFSDLVRDGLRYCWNLKTLTLRLPSIIPEDRASAYPTGHNVYANAFHILRWLPKGAVVRLEGQCMEEIKRVVEENGRLATLLDEVSQNILWTR